MAGIESLLIGRVLGGRYRIEEVIGRGGMGAVYRAMDERLGRQVALKVVILSGLSDPETRERLSARFSREARSAAALPHHPNVVPVYDYGRDEELGLDYIVMELLRGSDLATRLARSGPPPLAASIKILIEAARGLSVGHRQGLIHRDVKPGNIFLTQVGSNEVQVRVVDFGIAKLADDEDTQSQLTQDGRVPHSPAYAAPEQLRGLAQLTPAADVFGLGAVGYQLLCGERPFNESDRNRMSLGMPVEPVPPRRRNPAIPGAVEGAILRALAFDPADRFPDAGAMADELDRAIHSVADLPLEPYMGGAAIVTAAAGEVDRTQAAPEDDDSTRVAELENDRTLVAPPPATAAHPPNREPPAAGSAAATPPPPLRTPAPPRKPPPARRGPGGILVWILVLAVAAGAGLWGINEMWRADRLAFDPLPTDTLPEPIDTMPDPAQQAALEALLVSQDGVSAFELRNYAEALRHFARAIELAPDSARYRRNYGVTLFRIGLIADAERELSRAIDLDPGFAPSYFNLAEVRLAQGDTAQAIASFETYIQRETTPGGRALAQRQIDEIRAAQQDILLGEPVRPGPGELPPIADTLMAPGLPPPP